jgi:uncharacterized protein
MNNRFLAMLSALTLIALTVAAGTLAALWFRPRPTAAQTPATTPVRQITVVGEGRAFAQPDTATIQIGVQTDAPTAREALTANNTQMNDLIAKLKELGIAERDLQTSNLSIWPRYDNRGRQVEAYQVTNTVTVKIRNIAEAGELLDQVVDAGANNLGGISFLIDDPSALQSTARDAAIADGRQRAEAMAQAAGVTLGEVLMISETISSPPVYPMMRAEMADAAGSVPIQSGEQTITAQVQMTFEIR